MNQTAFDRALGFLQAGELEPATEICRKELSQQPEDDQLRTLFGTVLVRQNRFAEAETELRNVLSRRPHIAKANQELAIALIAQGRNEEAIEHYRRVVELRPDDPAAHRDLSVAYKTLGRMEEAYAALEEAFRLDPDRNELALVLEHRRAGALEQAAHICREALHLDPGNIDATRLLGMLAAELGNRELAIQALRNLVKLEPRLFSAYIDLAYELIEVDQLDECHEVLKKALELQPGLALSHALVGVLHNHAGRFEEAAEAFHAALRIQPNHSMSLAGLGHALKTVGRPDEAIETFQSCIREFPSLGVAYWALANLKTYRFSDEEVATMEGVLDDDDLEEESRVYINYSLGKACEDRGNYDQAFARYERGANLKRKRESYSFEQTRIDHDEIIQTITPALLRENEGKGYPDPAPIFIVGLPRSGSTLIEQILASHSQVDGTRELTDLPRMIDAINRHSPGGVGYPQALRLYGDALATIGQQYIVSSRRFRGEAPYFTDKMPGNFESIGLIALILPNARIINARRHPLDSCMGCYKQLFNRGQGFTYDLVELGQYYLEYQRLMNHWHEILPGRVLNVQYEQMVEDQENQTRRLLEHCGLPWEDQCLRFYETHRAVVTPSSQQVRQPIYSGSVDSWRRFEKNLGPLIEVLEPVL